MTVIDSLLAGLIDYAGLFPPASLDMRDAVENYLRYRQSKHAFALSRFIVDAARLDELRAAAGANLRQLKLSLTAPPDADFTALAELLDALMDAGLRIEAVEVKAASPAAIEQLRQSLPSDLEVYVELPLNAIPPEVLQAISAAGLRAKLRMGGVVAEAFPPTDLVANTLVALARDRIPFKATAGLHHPIRSLHALTYAPDSPTATMQGFLNLLCAAMLIHSGCASADAVRLLDEQDPHAWHLTAKTISWRGCVWSADQVTETRKNFFLSFGSCSFEEPIRDLEALGWL